MRAIPARATGQPASNDRLFGAVLACALLLAAAGPARAETFELGGLYTFHYHDGRYADWGDYALHGARIAISEINESGFLGADRLSLKPENTIDYHCWPDNVGTMTETLIRKDVLLITGADCSSPAVEISKVAARHGVPVISNGANASMLSSIDEHPWFVRVVPPSEAYEGYLVDLAAHFGVTEIAYLYTTDAWGLGARAVIRDYASRHDIEIAREFGFARDTAYETIHGYVAEAKDAGLRHIVMTGPTPDTVEVFRALEALDMNRPGYTIYAAEMISADEGAEAVNGSLGYFAPIAMLPPSSLADSFQAALESRLGHPVDPESKAFFYGALSYDHIFAVAHAIRSLAADGRAVDRGSLMQALREIDFQGVTGRIRIEPGTNDRADMPIQIMNSRGYGPDGKTVVFEPVGVADPATGQLSIDEDSILWPGGTTTAPQP